MTLSHFILFSSLEHTFTVRIKWWFHVSVVNQVRVYQDDHQNSLSSGSSLNKTIKVLMIFWMKLSSSSFVFPQKKWCQLHLVGKLSGFRIQISWKILAAGEVYETLLADAEGLSQLPPCRKSPWDRPQGAEVGHLSWGRRGPERVQGWGPVMWTLVNKLAPGILVRYVRTINQFVTNWSYLHQLSYLGGPTLLE